MDVLKTNYPQVLDAFAKRSLGNAGVSANVKSHLEWSARMKRYQEEEIEYLGLRIIKPQISHLPKQQTVAQPIMQALSAPVECGCCYMEYKFMDTTCCGNLESPHRFCLDCVKMYVTTAFENPKTVLRCIHESGCSALFWESEICRFLDRKPYQMFDKLRTQQNIREANIEGILYCPFCDFGAIMEDPTEKIFECLECCERSCRYCRAKSHHPKSCEEFQKEKKLDAKHAVEEAMTAAFIHTCNKCKQPFLKGEGCNKMTCHCGNVQCYVCRENVDGYNHFGPGKCHMYENTLKRQLDRVSEAQSNAIREARDQDFVTLDDLIVDRKLIIDIGEVDEHNIARKRRRVKEPKEADRVVANTEGYNLPIPDYPFAQQQDRYPPVATVAIAKSRGNNPYGSAGTVKCYTCRARRKKCEYDVSRPDLPCAYCAQRNLPRCVKVLAPSLS